MGMEGPPVKRFPVHVLTTHFQASGELETIGDAIQHINDVARNSLTLHNVQLTPVARGASLKTIQCPFVYLRKPQLVLLGFTTPEAKEAIRTLARRDLLGAYTPVAICRGYFHMPAESRLDDFMDVQAGELLPVSDATVFPLVALPEPFPAKFELLFLAKSHIQFFHEA